MFIVALKIDGKPQVAVFNEDCNIIFSNNKYSKYDRIAETTFQSIRERFYSAKCILELNDFDVAKSDFSQVLENNIEEFSRVFINESTEEKFSYPDIYGNVFNEDTFKYYSSQKDKIFVKNGGVPIFPKGDGNWVKHNNPLIYNGEEYDFYHKRVGYMPSNQLSELVLDTLTKTKTGLKCQIEAVNGNGRREVFLKNYLMTGIKKPIMR